MKFAWVYFSLALFVATGRLHAQNVETSAQSSTPTQVSKNATDEILVVGDRRSDPKAVRAMAATVTKRGPRDKPLPRFYQKFCPIVVGIRADYAATLVELVRDRAAAAGVQVATTKCQPNALLMFAGDARAALNQLRRDHPWLFTELAQAEIDRLAESNERAFAWQTLEIRGSDGKPVRIVVYADGSEIIVNDQWHASRLNLPVRMDVSGAALLIDNRHLTGKTLVQLADYASMRLLASTNDVVEEESSAPSTILSLFAAPESAPSEMTPFDIAYLRARYMLRPNVNALAIKDATAKAYTQETGK